VNNTRLALVPVSPDRGSVILPFVDGIVADHLRYLEARGRSSRTVEGRKAAIHLLVRHAGVPLRDVTVEHLTAWQDALTILSVNTRRSYISHVREFYLWARAEERLADNPARVLVAPQARRARPRPMPEQKMERALAAAPPRLRLWLKLAGYEGLRACEIAQVDRADIFRDGARPLLLVHGKGGKERIVPLDLDVLAELDAPWLPTTGRLFRLRNGRPVSAHYVSKFANEFLHKIGIPETLHQLRHRFGTQVYRAGRDILLTQELLGHASPATTAIYAAFDQDAAGTTVAAIARPLLRPVQETGT
jgi:integrase/recombinase XerC